MFGIDAQETVIIGLLALIIFGPGKLPQMARDLGRFVHKTRASVDEFKSELAFEEERKDLYEAREKDREPELWAPEAARELGNRQKTGKGRRPEELGKVHGGDRELAEEEMLEEDRHRKPAEPGLSGNTSPRR